MSLRISDTSIQKIRTHAAGTYPLECCGALIGTCERRLRNVEDLVELENRRPRERAHRRFLVSPDDYRRVERSAARRGLEVIGFYHSHPDHPPRPSEFDLQHAWPWYVYLIVGVNGGEPEEVACWTLAEDRSGFESLPLDVYS